MSSKSYTVKQIAELLGTKEDTVRRWIYDGKLATEIHSKKTGHAISSGELARFLKDKPKYAARMAGAAIASPLALSVVVAGLVGGIMAIADSKEETRITAADVKLSLDKKIADLEKQLAEQQAQLKKLNQEIAAKQEMLDRYVMTAKELDLADAGVYEELAENIRNAILNEYFTPTGRLSVDTQTGYLLALRFGIYRDKEKIVEGFKERYKKDCRQLKGGFVGATMMNTVLADNGMADIAYDLLCYEGFPGWLYAVNLGATTIWERWNSVLPDGSISGTGMNSLNHYSYGSVMEFLYRHGAGIQPLKPGFTAVRIAPKPDARLGKIACTYDSASGRIVSNWEILEDGKIHFHFEVPFGCEAEISLPEQEVFVVTAGSYDYTIQTKKNYRCFYHSETPVRSLLEDDRAVEILDRYLPGTVQSIDRTDAEAMSKSLNQMRYRAELFRFPTDAYDRAIEAISALQK